MVALFYGDADAFVSRLNANLSSLLQSSYLLGESDEDNSLALAIHAATGNVYVAGHSGSSDFPKTAGRAQPSLNTQFNTEGFIAHLNPDLTSLLQSTFLGGTSDDLSSAGRG